eukprot:UN21155
MFRKYTKNVLNFSSKFEKLKEDGFNFCKRKKPESYRDIFCNLKKLKNYGNDFCKLKNLKKHEFVFWKLNKLRKNGFYLLYASKISENVDFSFCKLENDQKKYCMNLVFASLKLKNYGDDFLQAKKL